MTDVKTRFHVCPKCIEAVPLSRSLFGRGSAFTCKRCKTSLITSKGSIFPAMAMFLPLFVFGKRILELEYGTLIIILLLIASSLLEYLFLSVSIDIDAQPNA